MIRAGGQWRLAAVLPATFGWSALFGWSGYGHALASVGFVPRSAMPQAVTYLEHGC